MAIDTHMHINNLVTKNLDEDIKRINHNNLLDRVINIGLNVETSKEIIKISDTNDKFFSTVGVHPLYVSGEKIEELIPLLINDQVLAIGEIGLDTINDNIAEQEDYLIRQIDIANNYHLPVIIHANNTNYQVLKIFNDIISPKYGCVFHCFQPDLEVLKELIKREYYISFAGRVTYKNAKKSLEVARIVPRDLFLVETDSPYISPEPKRYEEGKSEYLKYIIDVLAKVRNTSFEKLEEQTTHNAKNLFLKLK